MGSINHHLILGMTGTGKTFYAMERCRDYVDRLQVPALVFDPGFANWPTGESGKQFSSVGPFLTAVKIAEEGHACFIDESGQAIGRHGKEMNFCATQGRHLGHRFHFIAQRAQQIDLNTRTQCETVVLFRVGPKDAALMAEEFACRAFLEAPNLAAYEHIIKDERGQVSKEILTVSDRVVQFDS